MPRCSSRFTDVVRRGGLRLAALAFAAGSLFALTSDSFAQGTPAQRTTYTRDQQRGMIDDFSDSLQVRDRTRRAVNDRAFPNPPAGGVTAELKQLRPLIRDFSNDASLLTYSLNEQIRQTPALRPLYTDAASQSHSSCKAAWSFSRVCHTLLTASQR